MSPKFLDPELRKLVKKTVAILGTVIQQNAGSELYNKIEVIRKDMAQLRRGDHRKKVSFLEKTYQSLEKLKPSERYTIAHAFGLLLEIMNACENAYRSHVIKGRKSQFHSSPVKGIFYVLTAHPTESRSPENVALFAELQNLLSEILKTHFIWHEDSVRNLIERAWRTPITRQRKPQVSDEADYIYSIVLNPKILNALIKVNQQVAPFYIRSWVGGDKDGHPGVNAKTMIRSLNQSRQRLWGFMSFRLKVIEQDLTRLKQTQLLQRYKKINKAFKDLKVLSTQDGERIEILHRNCELFLNAYKAHFGALAPELNDIQTVLKVFPGLVIPLEFRESSDLIVEASKFQGKSAISEMIKQLKLIAGSKNPRWYVRGLIISMCGSMDHIQSGLSLIRHYFKEPKLPVIPLFEQESALQLSSTLVKEMLKDKFIQIGIKKFWHNRIEIMLGYSDSAKEVGSLQSRLLISETVQKIEAICSEAHVDPVFFHGSGGSVDRGGGSIKEQTAWLSKESLSLFKATIQGEMVERTFSNPEIFRSGIDQLAEQIVAAPNLKSRAKRSSRPSPTLSAFAGTVSSHYRAAITSPDFLEVVQKATPYRFLSALKLGSRPSRRGKVTNIQNLRAIPWVLCWTQTRILFPVWWGTGRTWKNLTTKEKSQLQREFKTNPVFRSYVKLLGFTLAKVELPIWEMYLRKSGIAMRKRTLMAREFREEYLAAVRFVHGVTQKNNLLWYRPWLKESIQLRSPMIHPLNLIQMIVMKTNNAVNMRESVAGIANGMLTTG